jgi:hypothetical protein
LKVRVKRCGLRGGSGIGLGMLRLLGVVHRSDVNLFSTSSQSSFVYFHLSCEK